MLKYFNSFQKSAFRVEMLQKYSVVEEQEAYDFFIKNKKLPDGLWADWHEIVKQAKARGAMIQRVHLIQFPMSSYLTFELEAYKKNILAGEEIFYLPFEECSIEIESDFWIFDDSVVLKMYYDENGGFLKFEEINDCAPYLGIKNFLLGNKKNIQELF